jgi:hypothetical protein
MKLKTNEILEQEEEEQEQEGEKPQINFSRLLRNAIFII